VHAPDGEGCPRGMAASPSTTRARRVLKLAQMAAGGVQVVTAGPFKQR